MAKKKNKQVSFAIIIVYAKLTSRRSSVHGAGIANVNLKTRKVRLTHETRTFVVLKYTQC